MSGVTMAYLMAGKQRLKENQSPPVPKVSVPPLPKETLTFGFKTQLLVPTTPDPVRLEPEHILRDQRIQILGDANDKGLARGKIEAALYHLIHDVMGCSKVFCEGLTQPGTDGDDDDDDAFPIPNKYTSWRIHTTDNNAEPGCFRNHRTNCLYTEPDSPFRFWDWKEAEISSPVFTTTVTNMARSLGWLGMKESHILTVKSLCRVLTREMRLNTSAFNGQPETSLGLSVFVGLGGAPIPETSLRRFLVVLWLLEDALYKFCPPWRTSGDQSAPLRRDSFLAHVSPLSLPQDGPPGLRDLIGPRLQQVIHPDKLQRAWYMWNVNFNYLPIMVQTVAGTGCVSIPGCKGHTVPNAIEIKHAGSNLRPGEIVSWTNVCLRLFQLCHFYERQDIHKWRLKALLELVVDAMWHDELEGNGEAGSVLLKQLRMSGDLQIWKDAEGHWNSEVLIDQLEMNPLCPSPADALVLSGRWQSR